MYTREAYQKTAWKMTVKENKGSLENVSCFNRGLEGIDRKEDGRK